MLVSFLVSFLVDPPRNSKAAELPGEFPGGSACWLVWGSVVGLRGFSPGLAKRNETGNGNRIVGSAPSAVGSQPNKILTQPTCWQPANQPKP